MISVYYLHQNGSLIFKLASCFVNTSVSEYMESSFVKKYWVMPENAPGQNAEECRNWMVNWLSEAYKLGAKKADIKRVCDANGLSSIAYLSILDGKKEVEKI